MQISRTLRSCNKTLALLGTETRCPTVMMYHELGSDTCLTSQELGVGQDVQFLLSRYNELEERDSLAPGQGTVTMLCCIRQDRTAGYQVLVRTLQRISSLGHLST